MSATAHRTAMRAPEADTHCPIMPNYGAPKVTFVRGAGTELWDVDGNRYLDFLCGLAVTSLGHAHPVVAGAIAQQANTLLHVSNLYGTEPQIEVARTLDALIRSGGGAAGSGAATDTSASRPEGGGAATDTSANRAGGAATDKSANRTNQTNNAKGQKSGQVLFQNSGAEANEGAIKLARKYQGRGRHVVLSAFRSFHGRTLATLAATGQPEKHEPFQPLPEGFRHAEWNDIEAFEAALDPTVGAILLEPVMGEAGVIDGDPAFFQGIRRLCDERGILLILDEVQTGLARTGEWWGFQHHGIEPDIVTSAKGLGNGMPIGAVWARHDVAQAFKPGDHGSTFGGQPLATAAAAAVLRVMQDIDAPRLAREQGAALRSQLEALPAVVSTHGRGMLVRVEFDPDALGGRTGADLTADCLAEGVVVIGSGPASLRLAPPLTISDEHLAEGVAKIAAAVSQES